MRTFVTSSTARVRLTQAKAFLETCAPSEPVWLLGPNVHAGTELIRGIARPAMGWRRMTPLSAAIECARPTLLKRGRAIASGLALEALWARVVFELQQRQALGRFAQLADRPGLARAFARTVRELRMLGIRAESLEPALAAALTQFESALAQAHLADRALIYQVASESLAGSTTTPTLVLLDVAPEAGFELEFVATLARKAKRVYATAPSSDELSVRRLGEALALTPVELPRAAVETPLAALQQYLFTSSTAPHPGEHTFTDIFSAPGEQRECVEIARQVLEAAATTPFERMAVLLRSPATYREPLEDAFRRAGVPVFFSAGLPVPDPAGRALLALIRCAEESLSARRFSEYLSLGQVPQAQASGAPPLAKPDAERFERPTNDTLLPAIDELVEPDETSTAEAVDPDAPVTAGQLRAPKRWERLIIDAAVIGGVDRWQRRLEGLAHAKKQALASPTLTEGHQRRLERELADLTALRDFALPLLETLAALPARATWGEWLSHLSALATRAIRHHRRLLALLAELDPMAIVGPVELREVRAVLSERLKENTAPSLTRREGCVLVAPVEQVRGLSFDLVFVPGLAERIFPQKVREDPLLSDTARTSLHEQLETNADRIANERLALRLAVGAAEHRAVLSWPRVDVEHARPRVPSFYALEAARAVEGALPEYETLQRRAEQAAQARLAWPAPRNAASAIDDTEYDLAILESILAARADVKGRARYLLEVSPPLARALRARYARWSQSTWTPSDGLVRPEAAARTALAKHHFSARPYSPTALEQYAACPYRFFLSAILRLAPLEIPGEIEELGPLEKGSMTHEVHFRLLSQLRDQGQRVSHETLEPIVFKQLDDVIALVTAEFADNFVPAIERVWKDGIEVMRADVREWLRRVAKDSDWEPWRFELSFGLGHREQQDPSSVFEPVTLSQGVQLRGSIDLVERHTTGHLRATDYKTGRAKAAEGNVVGGGRHLQPVLYALVLEKLFPEQRVESGRLLYCTQVGGFKEVPTPLDALAREYLGRVLRAIRSSLEEGFFPSAPAEKECAWCDYRAVCGPDEERRIRVTRKGLRAETHELLALRGLP